MTQADMKAIADMIAGVQAGMDAKLAAMANGGPAKVSQVPAAEPVKPVRVDAPAKVSKAPKAASGGTDWLATFSANSAAYSQALNAKKPGKAAAKVAKDRKSLADYGVSRAYAIGQDADGNKIVCGLVENAAGSYKSKSGREIDLAGMNGNVLVCSLDDDGNVTGRVHNHRPDYWAMMIQLAPGIAGAIAQFAGK